MLNEHSDSSLSCQALNKNFILTRTSYTPQKTPYYSILIDLDYIFDSEDLSCSQPSISNDFQKQTHHKEY